ncbi:hypothetical protein QQ054_16995 [Oscillatoria amoena NRMC-F 0135]|nr:hypothetical protein [Oscillatoria amoena NRMC-F 0135]
MFAQGINDFTVARADEPYSHLRYPVFVREADRHTGALTGLLKNEKEVNREVRKLNLLGYRSDELMVIEYVDSSDANGIHLKYSAFVLGECIMSRYLNFSRNWQVKSTVYPNDELMNRRKAEVEAYMKSNPHEAWLKKVFAEAGITYGRADYTVIHWKPQLWEINLNPAFVRPPKKIRKDHELQRMMRDMFYNRFLEELKNIDSEADEMVRLVITDEQERLMQVGVGDRLREWFHLRLIKDRLRYRVMRKICFSAAGWLAR